MDLITVDSFIIDKTNLHDNNNIIAKINVDGKMNNLRNSSKIDDFANHVVSKIHDNKHIYLQKTHGGRINILSAIIKKLNNKILFVCKNCCECDKHTEIFYNYESCTVTQLIKLKMNKITLSSYEVIIFIDVNNAEINLDWIDNKLSIILNHEFVDRSEFIDADKFFSSNIITNIYSFDSKIFYDNVTKFIEDNKSKNIAVFIKYIDYVRLFKNLNPIQKINSLTITYHWTIAEGFDVKNFDTLYFLNYPIKKRELELKETMRRFFGEFTLLANII